MNSYNCIGRLGQMPVLDGAEDKVRIKGTNKEGKSVPLSIAVKQDGRDEQGNRKTMWLTIEAWGKTAEHIAKFFKCGDRIALSGCPLFYEEYDKKDGTKGYQLGIRVPSISNISFIEKKEDGQGKTQTGQYAQAYQSALQQGFQQPVNGYMPQEYIPQAQQMPVPPQGYLQMGRFQSGSIQVPGCQQAQVPVTRLSINEPRFI